MPLADVVVQSLLVAQVGDTENGALTNNVANVWAYYTDDLGAGTLRDLYVKRALIDIALGAGGERLQSDFIAGDVAVKQGQRRQALTEMRAATQVEIERLEEYQIASSVPVVGVLATTAPRTALDALNDDASVYRDANDPMYRGDPYDRRFPR